MLADRVSASLSAAAIFIALALIVTLITGPRTGSTKPARSDLEPRLAAAQNPAYRGAETLAETHAADA
jgi:hypothetical protein